MTDQFHQAAAWSWNPFSFFLGLGGVFSSWWLALVSAVNVVVADIAFYGGAFLVAWQVGRLAHGGVKWLRQQWGNG